MSIVYIYIYIHIYIYIYIHTHTHYNMRARARHALPHGPDPGAAGDLDAHRLRRGRPAIPTDKGNPSLC